MEGSEGVISIWKSLYECRMRDEENKKTRNTYRILASLTGTERGSKNLLGLNSVR